MDIVLTTVRSLFTLAVFIVIGFVLQRKKLVPEQTATGLSALEMYLFLPATVLSSFVANCTPETLKAEMPYIMWGTIMILISCVIAYTTAYFFDKSRGMFFDVIAYAVTFPNVAYIGYPLITMIYGEEMLFHMIMMTIPFNVLTYTLGYYQLNPMKKMNFKTFINPAMIAIAIGTVIGLCNIKLPAIVGDILTSAGNCIGPCAMLLTGMILARRPFFSQFKSGTMYILAFMRDMIIPAVVILFMYIVGVRGELFVMGAACIAMPMGLNSVVLTEALGGDSARGAQAVLMSNTLSLVSIHIVLFVATALAG